MPSRQFSQTPNTKSRLFFLATAISTFFLLLCALLYFIIYLCNLFVQRSRTSPIDSTFPLTLRRFSFKELKSATNDFRAANLIGHGGSGTVYFGILRDGKSVAIKKLHSSSVTAEREFLNELQILGSLKSPLVVTLLGYCVRKRDRLLVYEYMPNRSLQEVLFSGDNSNSNSVLNWERRFGIILDIAGALEFLHNGCEPSVIHGDIKPSNVLLDSEYRARISDFGLSRLKTEGDFGIELFSTELLPSQELLSENLGTVESPNPYEKIDPVVSLQPSCSSRNNSSKFCHTVTPNDTNTSDPIPKGKETSCMDISSVYYNEICSSVEHRWELDWWWKQNGSGDLCSKDHVMEWLGSQICADPVEMTNAVINSPNIDDFCQIDKSGDARFPDLVNPSNKRRKQKTMQDCWKEEQRCKKIGFRIPLRLKRLKMLNKRNNSEMWSGDVMSSSTSVRGTLCYVAPEFGSCEKGDVYSLGVVILVIVSGRRPLHVLSSPMRLEKANLISWCRQLGQKGSLLEVVDESLGDEHDKEQASLCVNVALACLQRVPELRPEIGDVVRILKGEMEISPLSLHHLSPSPPSRKVGRSGGKHRSEMV